jgi:hypothetical protein
MFTFLHLGIFVAVGNVLILKVKIWSSLQSRLLFYPNSVTKHEYGRYYLFTLIVTATKKIVGAV